MHPCRVCQLLRSDHNPKPSAQWCYWCQSWICDACRDKYGERLVAFVKALKRRARLL